MSAVFTRRSVSFGLLAALLCGPAARAAKVKPPEAEQIFTGVRASDGYLDAALHARFHKALAEMVGPDKVASWLADRSRAQGDPTLAARFETELWASAIDSVDAGHAEIRPGLAAVQAEILALPETEAVALRRLAAAVPEILAAAASQGWVEVDGQSYVLMMLECQTLLGSIDARRYRVDALLKPVYAPSLRRWGYPGCPVAFDLDVAIGTRFDSDFPETTTYLATLGEGIAFFSSIRPLPGQGDAKAVLAVDADIASYRTSKGGRIIGHDDKPFRTAQAARLDYFDGRAEINVSVLTAVLADRGQSLSIEIYGKAPIEALRLWRDRLEAAVVLV